MAMGLATLLRAAVRSTPRTRKAASHWKASSPLRAIEAARDADRGRVGVDPLRLSRCAADNFGRSPGPSQARNPSAHRKLQTARGDQRGAFARAGRRARGVVTASTGNHGRALAHAAERAGDAGDRGLPVAARAEQQGRGDQGTRRRGAYCRKLSGRRTGRSCSIGRGSGLTQVQPFDRSRRDRGPGHARARDRRRIFPTSHLVLVPLSGGGLASGVAAAVKASSSEHARVSAYRWRVAPPCRQACSSGRPVHVEELETLADSLGGGIGLDNRFTFRMCRDLLDDVVLLTEEEIAAGIRHAYVVEGEVVEGAGAVGIAALLAGKVVAEGPTVVVVSGRQHR